ncbi:Uncharacterized protein SCF082_LOCUS50712, partial [Durusdinium trenchii]
LEHELRFKFFRLCWETGHSICHRGFAKLMGIGKGRFERMRRVRATQVSFLSSGHSHEDIDGYFSQVAQYLQSVPEMWTPKAYVDSIQKFMDSTERRPLEKHYRKAYLLTQALPHLGPGVGPGVAAQPAAVGRDLDAAPNPLNMVHQRPDRGELLRKEEIVEKGLTVDIFLSQHLSDEANAIGFFKFLDNSFPATSGVSIRAHEDLGIEDVKLLSPGNAFMVKGWNRSVCCLTVCYAAYQNPHLLQVVRLEKDWLAIAPKNRRPWNLKDVDSRFELRHGDADLTQLLEGSVPPADLQRVSIFSSHIQKYYAQGALDFKHINDRFQKGKEWCSDFLERKHQLIHVNSLVLAHSTIVSAQAEMGPDGLTILVVDATLWPTRQISIDEAIQLCASVSSGNTSSVAFFCMPQCHSSTKRDSVLKNRRLLEDKVGAYPVCMAAICASSNSAFTKSKALLGSICDIERSRVGELQNPDPERSLAPHWRVQQRGISATSGIIKHLLEGVSSNAQQPVLVCDLLPNRFSEWSLATWDLQSAFLMETNRELDLRFLGVYHSDNADELSAANEVLMGRLIADYWDGCDKAGPKTREASGFSEAFPTLQSLVVNEGEIKLPELLQQKYSQQAGLKEFLEKISADADMAAALRSYH